MANIGSQRIFQLQHEDQIIEGEDALNKHISRYYKNLSGPSEMSTISLDESRTKDISQVTMRRMNSYLNLLVKRKYDMWYSR
jgi:hypothetical protein